MRAVLIASGEPHPSDARWLAGADLVVAVDAGAAWLAERGARPDALVGDLDSVATSLVAQLEADGVAIERHPTAKDSSDTELAVAYACRRGADDIVVLGAFGGPRLDHELANILLLAAPEVARASATAEAAVRLVRDGTTVRLLGAASAGALSGEPGSLVSLFPVGGDAIGVTTAGLAYPLANETLTTGSTRGLSNVVTTAPASVQLRLGALLIVEQPADAQQAEGDQPS